MGAAHAVLLPIDPSRQLRQSRRPLRLRLRRAVRGMTVHVGEITSEVTSPRSDAVADAGTATGDTAERWEQQVRTSAMLHTLARDRARTATGYGDD